MIEFDENLIINRKGFDLKKEKVYFDFDQYSCSLDCNEINGVVEMFVLEKDNTGNAIKNTTYYMTEGYYAFVGTSRTLLIYMDLTKWGYVGTNVDNI